MHVYMYADEYVCRHICNFTVMDNENSRIVINGFLKFIISVLNVHVGSWDNIFSIKYLGIYPFSFGGVIKLIYQKVLRILFLFVLRHLF